jgi:hypothetical protein
MMQHKPFIECPFLNDCALLQFVLSIYFVMRKPIFPEEDVY